MAVAEMLVDIDDLSCLKILFFYVVVQFIDFLPVDPGLGRLYALRMQDFERLAAYRSIVQTGYFIMVCFHFHSL
jgi:NADH:ubiquinone oxidoreductase subunit 2 (subunit N)